VLGGVSHGLTTRDKRMQINTLCVTRLELEENSERAQDQRKHGLHARTLYEDQIFKQ